MGSRNKKRSVGLRISLFFFVAICVALIVLIALSFARGGNSLPVLGNPGHVTGRFSLMDQDGRIVTEAQVSGKIRVVEYFFTTCKGICPIMNLHLQKVDRAFSEKADVVIISHTVDPEHDSVDVMSRYARSMSAKAGKWYFLTGSKHDLYTLAISDYLLSVDSTGADIDHQFIHTPYVALVDRENRIRGFYDATSDKEIEKLIGDINKLL